VSFAASDQQQETRMDLPENPPEQAPGHYGAGYGEQAPTNATTSQPTAQTGAETTAPATPPPVGADEDSASGSGSTTVGDDGNPVVFTPDDVGVRPPDHPPTENAPESEKSGLIFERS